MMLLLKALLALKVLTAASAGTTAPVGKPVYENCSEAAPCGEGLICEVGVCTPAYFCTVTADCPEAPEAYSMVCDAGPTCTGIEGACRLAPGAHNECPEGTLVETGVSGVDICVGS